MNVSCRFSYSIYTNFFFSFCMAFSTTTVNLCVNRSIELFEKMLATKYLSFCKQGLMLYTPHTSRALSDCYGKILTTPVSFPLKIVYRGDLIMEQFISIWQMYNNKWRGLQRIQGRVNWYFDMLYTMHRWLIEKLF